jgi:hypothetical protein
MGAEAINGLIDQAASMGGGMANMFAPGAGAAIGIGAEVAKRGVQYGAEMAGIGIGAISEILLPFGAPRWLTDVDPTSFMPQGGTQPAAVTSGEKARQDMFAKNAGMIPGSAVPAMEGPTVGRGSTAPLKPHLARDQHLPGANLQPGAPNSITPGSAPPAPPAGNPNDPLNLLKTLLPFDTGGVLKPNSMGINLSNRPEYVFTQSQFKQMEAGAANGSTSGATYHVTGQNDDHMIRELKKKERLAAMTHMSRP